MGTLRHESSIAVFLHLVGRRPIAGDYKQSDYGKVILPFTVLRRLDCVLEATKPKVLAEFAAKTKQKLNPDPFLLRASGQSFYNTSPMDMGKLMGDQDHIRENLFADVQAFSPATRDIFERFDFATQTVVDGISQQSRRQFHGRFVRGSLAAVTRGL
jgi:type I restriction-modification system DNA methylase subunit